MSVAFEIHCEDTLGSKKDFEEFRGQNNQRSHVYNQALKRFDERMPNIEVGETLRLIDLPMNKIISQVTRTQ